MLDGGNGATTPKVLEAWELDGCFLSQVDWGEMAYSASEHVQIALTIKFVFAGHAGTTINLQSPKIYYSIFLQ